MHNYLNLMKISEKGLTLIKGFEGLELKAYRCPAGVLTIGYGHTGMDVLVGQVITEAKATELLRRDMARFEAAVSRYVTRPLRQNQFDALVSLCYNVGEGNLWKSTVLRLVNANPDDPAIRAAFAMWNKGGGKVLPGLVRRRAKEAELYFSRS
jgi:lysozyme